MSESPTIPSGSQFCALNIVIIGGGVAGLSAAFCLGKTGHKVTLVESAPMWPKEIGAGIQAGPNMSRLLIRWGLQNQLDKFAVKPASASFRRYDSDEMVGFNLIGDRVEKDHGSPYYHLHREDLIDMLYGIAKPFLKLTRGNVVSVASLPSPTVTLESGEVLKCDLIIGADGIKSVVRKHLVGSEDRPTLTGDLAYRAILPANKLLHDPELKPLMETPEATCWMGPGRHIVGYCVKGKAQYNLVLICPDVDSEESWTATADIDEVKGAYKGWNKRVTKLLEMLDSARKSKLVVRPPLTSWLDNDGRIALMGDACHSMLPYLAQGAAMAIEDAAVLGRVLCHISNPSQIGFFLQAYQNLRLTRANGTQRASEANQKRFHLPDGPEQQARDAAMKAAMEATLREVNASPSTSPSNAGNSTIVTGHDKRLASMQFDYDAEAAADLWWTEVGQNNVTAV